MDLTRIADELYVLPPHVFTAARDEQVDRARSAGDRGTATGIAALKRPTVGAWLVNVVALRRPDVVRRLLQEAAAIRAAGSAVELRGLSQRRRQAIDAVLGAARELAAEAGAPAPNRQQLAEVESTLTAAMADPDAEAQVVAGRVLKALSYGGFGGLGDLGGAFVASTGPGRAGSTPVGRAASARRTDPAGMDAGAGDAAVAQQSARAAAQARVSEAERAVDDASATERAARLQVDELTRDIESMRSRLEEAERLARVARQARQSAERDLATAQRRLARLT